jgi:hypothetical protein
VGEIEPWLSETQGLVASVQQVLSEVERGLDTIGKVEAVAKRTRPVLRRITVVILGCLVVLGVVILVNRKRREGQVKVPVVESPEDGVEIGGR